MEGIFSRENYTTEKSRKLIPCKAQKWTFKPMSDDNGQIIHQEKNNCLSFNKKQSSNTTKVQSKSMLHFLSNVVKEAVQEMDTPILQECNEYDENQLWLLNLAAKWS